MDLSCVFFLFKNVSSLSSRMKYAAAFVHLKQMYIQTYVYHLYFYFSIVCLMELLNGSLLRVSSCFFKVGGWFLHEKIISRNSYFTW